MKKLMIYILCALMLLSLCACAPAQKDNTPPSPTPTTTPQPAPEPTAPVSAAAERKLVCIGDSIASGYALPMAAEQRFSAIIAENLSSEAENWSEYNYAVPGHTSGDMLELLSNGAAPELANADLIIVCIGANNVLRPAQTFLMKYGSYSLAQISGDDSGLTAEDIRAAYNDFRASAESGAESLRSDLAAAMEYISSANSEARVIFMTVYNPYKTNETEIDIGGLPIPMNVMSDTFVKLINDVLAAEAASLGYELADVYSAFEAENEHLINGDGAASFIADPHPNAAGHALIAETYLQTIAAA